MEPRTITILQQWENGDLSEGQVVKKLGKPRVQVREMKAKAIAAGEVKAEVEGAVIQERRAA